MNEFGKRLFQIALFLGILFFLFSTFHTLQARKYRWYIGGGGAFASISGGPEDGERFETDPILNDVVYGAEFDNGFGLNINGGFALNRYLAFEFLFLLSDHDATNSQNPEVRGQVFDTTFSVLNLTARGMLPIGKTFEIFGRVGPGFYQLSKEVPSNRIVVFQVKPGGSFSGSERTDFRANFSGWGVIFGGGVAMNFGRLGLEFAISQHEVKLDELSDDRNGNTISIDERLSSTMATFTFTVEFGKRL